jgi:galactokinase
MSEEGRALLHVSTPGRICLFGEHQDYLGLPVIPCAISLRVGIEVRRRADRQIVIDLPDTGTRQAFSLDQPLRYELERDYFRSALRVLREAGFEFPYGLDCRVHGDIPINAGTSSSTALVVSWVNVLARSSAQARILEPKELAFYAHRAEVVEFNEPGGKMDHFSTSLGGVLHLAVEPHFRIEQLTPRLKTFVLGNSGEPKDTRKILSRVKSRILAIVEALKNTDQTFSLATAHADTWPALSSEDRRLLAGTIRNRDITSEGLVLLRNETIDEARFGRLLLEHQTILRDDLGISTPKIDRMIDAACAAGALGGKINGSGGGGCMFVYAPEGPGVVAEAIARVGGQPHVVTIDGGSNIV